MERMSNQTFVLLPIELRIKILQHFDDPPSLLSALLSCRAFHDAYAESTQSIKDAVLVNSTSPQGMYCKYLTYALRNFCNPKRIDVHSFADFFSSYLNFSNPPQGVSLSTPIDLPPTSSSKHIDPSEVHHYTFLWAQKFCEDKLKVHPVTEEPIFEEPPTETEIARVAKVLYQFWLYCVLHSSSFRSATSDKWMKSRYSTKDPIMQAFAETIGYTDSYILFENVVPWLQDLLEPLASKFVEDPQNPVRLNEIEFVVSWNILRSEIDGVASGLIARLGPVELWKFLFEADYSDQFRIYCQEPAHRIYSLTHDMIDIDVTRRHVDEYDPILKICHEPLTVEKNWYNWWEDLDCVAKNAIMWDDWRLGKWGFEYPEVNVPAVRIESVLFYGEGPPVKNEYEIKFHWRRKGSKWRDLFFKIIETEKHQHPVGDENL
ncbi:hypothetical protein ABW19_dt0205562 [Dactylella cylindrospora]|nr:hypothetical protein ABW19_dt0205562 [Dactylella cylindrospora]